MFLILTLGVISLLVSFLLTPVVRDLIGRGFLDLPDGDRKRQLTAIPRVGGIAIALSYAVTFAIAMVLPFSYSRLIRDSLPTIEKLVVPAVLVFVTGMLDDRWGFKAWQKLIGIGGAAGLAIWGGIHVNIRSLSFATGHPWIGAVITFIWLIGCTNAFNLIDGMDGLAAGVGLFAAGTMLVAALAEGHLPLAMAVIPLVGALFGFLRYNFHPASVYLGDAGSLLIGFVLGCCGALWSEKSVALVAMTAPMLAVSVPLLDVTLSILRRFLRNKPIFKGDRGHIHHKLLDRGLSPRVAVLTVYGLCALMAALSLLANALRNQFTGVVVVVFCTLLWIFVRSLGYAEFAMATRMFLKGGFQRVIDTEAKLEDLRRALATAENVNECWKMILTASREFGFGGVRMSVAGNVFEESTDSANGPVWQLRIPLAEAQYINFARDFEADVNPLVLSAFVNCIQTGLMARMSELESIPVRIPAKPQLAFSGAVGSSAKPS